MLLWKIDNTITFQHTAHTVGLMYLTVNISLNFSNLTGLTGNKCPKGYGSISRFKPNRLSWLQYMIYLTGWKLNVYIGLLENIIPAKRTISDICEVHLAPVSQRSKYCKKNLTSVVKFSIGNSVNLLLKISTVKLLHKCYYFYIAVNIWTKLIPTPDTALNNIAQISFEIQLFQLQTCVI